MPDTADELEPVVRRLVVHCSADHAFNTFTSDFQSWWPVATHSLEPDRVTGLRFDATEGGVVAEVWDDGSEHQWASVLAWEPPSRLVLAWDVGQRFDAPTEVEVTFTEERPGLTRLVLEHRGWGQPGAAGADERESYDAGWRRVLVPFERAANDPEVHKTFGISLNLTVWGALDRTDRTADDDQRMVDAAHASLWHWAQMGTDTNLARGEWLCAHVYTVLGRTEPAVHHARRCLAITEAAGLEDFDLGYAYEGIARALALAGEVDEAASWRAKAAGVPIADDIDREIYLADLEAGPWFALPA